MLTSLQRGHRLLVVEERRSGDIDQVHVIPIEQLSDVVDVLDPKPRRRGQRRRPMGAGHSHELDTRHLRELLEGKQAKPAAAHHAQSYGSLVHGFQILLFRSTLVIVGVEGGNGAGTGRGTAGAGPLYPVLLEPGTASRHFTMSPTIFALP